MSSRAEKGKNITSSMNFTSTKPVEPKREKTPSSRGRGEGAGPDSDRPRGPRTGNRGDGRQYSSRSMEHSVDVGSPTTPLNTSVTSFSGVHQPAYRKNSGAPNRTDDEDQQKARSASSERGTPVGDEQGQQYPRPPMYGHFVPGMPHPMHPQMMMDPFGGFVQYGMPPGRPMPAPVPHAVPQAPKVKIVIEDDSGSTMNLSSWKEQKSEEDKEVEGADDEPASTDTPVKEAEQSPVVASPTPEAEPAAAESTEEKKAEEAEDKTLTYELMLSYRFGKVDLKLIAKDILAVRSEIEERNSDENRGADANKIAYFQPEVETRQSLFGSNVTQAFKPRQQFSNQAENPFTATRSDSLDHVAKTKKAIQGALNKITTSNYEQLSQTVMDIDFPELCAEQQLMEDIIGMFFDKAINEPAWASVYASLFRDIRNRWGTTTNAEGESEQTAFSKAFRRQLLAHCQTRFESGRRLQEEISQLPEDQQERSLPLLRKQIFNNMRFIGELYKEKLITKRVMHRVIYDTIFECDKNKLSDEALEMCCELLTSIGSSLEEPNNVEGKPFMETYFESFAKLAKVYPTPRVRFKIQNLIDLRANNWDTSRPVPETPLELKSRAKQFLAKASPQPPAQPAKPVKVMNRSSASSQKSKSSARNSESAQPTTPTTPVTPTTAKRISDRRKWHEVMPEFIKEQVETIVETLQKYTADSRRAFLEEMFNYLLGVRFHEERAALHELMPALLKGDVLATRDIDATCLRCVRDWVENEAMMDQPKLWESWMDILCACLKTEAVTSADCLEQALSDLIEKDDAENIAVFIAHVNKKLRQHDQSGFLLRTLDLLKRPKQLEAVLESDKASVEGFDHTIEDFKKLEASKLGELSVAAKALEIQRRLYVLTTYLALNAENASCRNVVLPLYSNVRSLFTEVNEAERYIMQEVQMVRRLDIPHEARAAVWDFLEKNNIMNA